MPASETLPLLLTMMWSRAGSPISKLSVPPVAIVRPPSVIVPGEVPGRRRHPS